MKCPNCGLINPESSIRCDCGYDFKNKRILKSYIVEKPIETKYEYKSYLLTRMFFWAFILFVIFFWIILLHSPSSDRSILGLTILSIGIIFFSFKSPFYLIFNLDHIIFHSMFGIKFKFRWKNIIYVKSEKLSHFHRIYFKTRFWNFYFDLPKGEEYRIFEFNIQKVIPNFNDN